MVSAYLKEQKDYCILCGEIRGPEMRSLTCTIRVEICTLFKEFFVDLREKYINLGRDNWKRVGASPWGCI